MQYLHRKGCWPRLSDRARRPKKNTVLVSNSAMTRARESTYIALVYHHFDLTGDVVLAESDAVVQELTLRAEVHAVV